MQILFTNPPGLRGTRSTLRYALLSLSFAATLGAIPASRAATLFEDDFSNSTFSDENWTYVDEAPDYSGDSAAFGSTASQMYVPTVASNLASGLTWSMDLSGNDTDPDGDPLVYITMGSGLFGIGTYTSDDDFYYSVVLDLVGSTLSLQKTTSTGVELLDSYTVTQAPENGTVSIDENGSFISFVYTPTSEVPGDVDNFTAKLQVTVVVDQGSDSEWSLDEEIPIYFGIGGTNVTYDNVSLQTAPEPSVMALIGAAVFALAFRRRRQG